MGTKQGSAYHSADLLQHLHTLHEVLPQQQPCESCQPIPMDVLMYGWIIHEVIKLPLQNGDGLQQHLRGEAQRQRPPRH